jgi:hypothetical protein
MLLGCLNQWFRPVEFMDVLVEEEEEEENTLVRILGFILLFRWLCD